MTTKVEKCPQVEVGDCNKGRVYLHNDTGEILFLCMFYYKTISYTYATVLPGKVYISPIFEKPNNLNGARLSIQRAADLSHQTFTTRTISCPRCMFEAGEKDQSATLTNMKGTTLETAFQPGSFKGFKGPCWSILVKTNQPSQVQAAPTTIQTMEDAINQFLKPYFQTEALMTFLDGCTVQFRTSAGEYYEYANTDPAHKGFRASMQTPATTFSFKKTQTAFQLLDQAGNAVSASSGRDSINEFEIVELEQTAAQDDSNHLRLIISIIPHPSESMHFLSNIVPFPVKSNETNGAIANATMEFVSLSESLADAFGKEYPEYKSITETFTRQPSKPWIIPLIIGLSVFVAVVILFVVIFSLVTKHKSSK
jgi:hypothetical protein